VFQADKAISNRLKAFANSLVKPITQMNTGLSLSDFHPYHTGRRRGTDELLAFDLECVEYGSRFRMVAAWLSASDSEETYCCPRDELAAHYLHHYTLHGGSSVTLEEFLHEIRILGMVGYLSMFGADWWIQRLFDRPKHSTHGDEDEDHNITRNVRRFSLG